MRIEYSAAEIAAHEARKQFHAIADDWESQAIELEGDALRYERAGNSLDALASFQAAEYAKYQHLFFRALAEYARADEMKECGRLADESLMWDYLDEEHRSRKWADRYAEKANQFLMDHPYVARTLEGGE